MNNTPTVGVLLQRATAMREILRQRRDETRRRRSLTTETVTELKQAGFFKMMQPKRYGGYEQSPADFYRVVMEVARGCPSTGWVLSVVGVHNWQLALFDQKAQDEVWADNHDALISSSYMPNGQVTPVDGGYRLSGHWQFSSGCDHCDWVFVGALIPGSGDDEPPAMHTFLLPRSDYSIDDDWHTSGLQGSGSKGIKVNEAFVPAHRTHSFRDGYLCDSPGHATNDNPIYKLPFGQVFVRAVSAPSIGAAEGALDHYCEYNRGRINSSGLQASTLPAALQAAADARSAVSTARLKLFHAFDTQLDAIRAGQALDMSQRAEFKYDSSRAVSDCLQVVQQLLANSGGRAIYDGNPINGVLQDMLAFRQHAMNDTDKPGRSLGTVMFGGDCEDLFL